MLISVRTTKFFILVPLLTLLTLLDEVKSANPFSNCKDMDSAINMGIPGGDKTCGWLATQETSMIRRKCSIWPKIKNHCLTTCKQCPTLSPTPEVCEDRDGTVEMGKPYGKEDCKWLSTVTAVIKENRCEKWPLVRSHCLVSCNQCSTPSPTPERCEDKDGTVDMGNPFGEQACKWLDDSAFKATRNEKCEKWPIVQDHCPKTCKQCVNRPVIVITENCKDKVGTVEMGKPHGKRTCGWLDENASLKRRRCKKWPNIFRHCLNTCGACSSLPQKCEDKKGTINMGYPFGEKKCIWLAGAPMTIRENRCNDWPKIQSHCLVTCGECKSPPTASPTQVTPSPMQAENSITSPTRLSCKNKSGFIFMGSNYGSKACEWLSEKGTNTRNEICEIKSVRANCYKSCSGCSCINKPGTFNMSSKYGAKTCEWLSGKGKNTRNNICENNSEVKANCYKVCTGCL